ncbi:MAG: glycosyltransferase family 4 protein [Methanobrevibacter sp.]|nr:glycosyltransferase family 4 protein [Methanobrevibacter sp.]
MKIAMVGQFPPHIGGVGVHIHSLSKELLKNGEEVFVITYPHKDIKNDENEEYMDYNGIKVISTYGINIGGIRSLFYTFFGTLQLIKTVRKYNIDIIHGHYLFPGGLIAVLAGIFTKKKVYVTAHGSDIFCLYPQHKFMQPVIKFVLKKVDVVLAVSEALKEEILKINIPNIENKVKLNWNTVNINEFKPEDDLSLDDMQSLKSLKKELNIPENKHVIIFVGNIIKRKNVATILDGKKHLKSDCTLVVVGDGPLLSNLKEKAKDEEIRDVIFTGARNDVADLIRISDILILPSFSESFGLVLIEALACGKPVIGSNVGGIKEIITKDVGLLVEPNDYNGLANAIDLILTDNDLREKFKLNARNRAIDFAEVDIPYYEDKLNEKIK